MIKGLEKFSAHFKGLESQYVLIGGTATYLLLSEAGLEPRATKDLDIVLSLEAPLDAEFGKAFWDFVKQGQYENSQGGTDKKIYYRFTKPKAEDFPLMLELFAVPPKDIKPPEGVTIIPIHIDDDISSLSAILLDSEYYAVLQAHRRGLNGVSIVGELGLIPLKAKAWLDLTERKAKGASIDSKNINKHRGDIIRLYQLLKPDQKVELPESIKKDMRQFLAELEKAEDLDLNAYITAKVKIAEIVGLIRKVYQLEA